MEKRISKPVPAPCFLREQVYIYLQHNTHLVGTQCQTDTTVSALSTFFLAMLANPEAQRKAQTEIDAVTGGKYLPDFDDEAAMPYVSALVKEVLRWKNVTPMGMSFIEIPLLVMTLPLQGSRTS
jgi:hypothetical protein